MKIERSAKLETAVHLITAFVLILKGFDKLSHEYYIFGSVILAFGILVLLITFFHKRLNISHNLSKGLVYMIEAIALAMIAYMTFKENKVYLPYFYLFPSIAFFVVAFLNVKGVRKQ